MDDTISRQAAIDKVWNITKIVPTMAIRAKDALETIPSAQPDVARDIATIIENEQDMRVMLASQQEQRWIPVTERLPEKAYGQYWVCTDTGYQCQCRWTDDVYGLGSSGEWTWKIFDIPQYSHVIAWMPLPEPYKEDES